MQMGILIIISLIIRRSFGKCYFKLYKCKKNYIYDEYKRVYKDFFKDSNLPIMYNINFGHAVPRCFLQYNATATVDYDKKTIKIKSCKL